MKISLGRIPLIYPIPIVLVGAYVDGKINYVEVGDVAVMGIGTPLIAISLNTNHYTTKGIKEHGVFSINIPTADMMGASDSCGIYSGKKIDKSTMFTNTKGKHGTPLIDECPVSIECKVAEQVIIKNRHIFIAEVLETFIDDNYTEKIGGKVKIADMKKLNPLIYSLDNKYYTIGEAIGEGYKEGKKD
jgi:flavin reductase (DIM6/NTAB) family NADH-FMN oxidoreductase RutF